MHNKVIKHRAYNVLTLALVATLLSPALAFAEKPIQRGPSVSVRYEHVGKDQDRDFDRDGEGRGRDVATGTPTSSRAGYENLPPGIRTAPGIEKRVENGKGLPRGILKFFQNVWNKFPWAHNGTSTTMNVFRVLNVQVVTTGTSSVSIAWRTEGNATTELRYGTSSPVTASSTIYSNSALTTDHTATLTGLSPDTLYHFVIAAQDANGKIAFSAERTFRTKRLVTMVSPNILFSTTYNVQSTSAQIVWVTNVRSDSRAWLATTTPATTAAPTLASANLVFLHNMTATNLTASTTYYYVVQSANADGGASATTSGSFTTSAAN